MSNAFNFIRFQQLKVALPVVLILPYIYAWKVTDTTVLADEDFKKNFEIILPH